MRVILTKNGLRIVPMTDFEEQYLSLYSETKLKVFLKHGMSPKDIVGLEIQKVKNE